MHEIAKFLRLERRDKEQVEHGGVHLSIAEKGTRVYQATAAKAVEYIGMSPTRNKKFTEELAIAEELSAFRGAERPAPVAGSAARGPTVTFEQSRLAGRASKLKVADLIATDKLKDYGKEAMENGLCF